MQQGRSLRQDGEDHVGKRSTKKRLFTMQRGVVLLLTETHNWGVLMRLSMVAGQQPSDGGVQMTLVQSRY